MEHKRFLYPTVIVLTIYFSLSQIACEKASYIANSKDSSITKTRKNISSADKKIANQKLQFGTPSEAMSYFFYTFFSNNFIGAYRTTSSDFSDAHPFAKTDKEWHEFSIKTSEQGLNRKNLSYRSDFKSSDGDISGIVLSPNGQMIMRVYLKRLEDGSVKYWAVDNILLFEKNITAKESYRKERTDLTNQPNSNTYKAIRLPLIEIVSNEQGHPSYIVIKQLIISNNWARCIFENANKPGTTNQVVLRQIDGKWTIIGRALTYNEYPESPYMLWAADNWK